MAKIIDPDFLDRQSVVFDTTNKTIKLNKVNNLSDDGVTLLCLYSFAKEEWKDDPELIKYPFPFVPITDQQFELVNGWDFADDDTRKLIRDAGWAVNPSGTIKQMWANIKTLGPSLSTHQVYYLQSPNGDPVDFRYTGPVNEAILIYDSDQSLDYRDFLQLFCREWGYTYAFSQLSDIGETQMTYKSYTFALSNTIDSKIDPNFNINNAPYNGMSITWYTSAQDRKIGQNTYNFHVIINGNGGTAEQIYTFVQYQLMQDTDIDAGPGEKKGKITPQLLRFVGDTLYTLAWKPGEGTYIDNHREIDRVRIYFTDDTGNLRMFPYAAILTLNFGENLINDPDAIYRVFYANNFGTSNAQLVETFNVLEITSISGSNGTVTVETSSPHHLSVGDVIEISGTTDFDGTYIVQTIVNSTTFTFSADITGSETSGTVIQLMGGKVNGRSSVQLTFDYDGKGGTDVNIVAVAIGLSKAQYVKNDGVITRSQANSVALIAALERNYYNP